MLPSGRRRIFHNRIHWAKFYMTKAGLIDSPARGRFVASQAGRALLATNPVSINVDTLKTYPAFAEFYASSTSGSGSTNTASAGAGESIYATTSATPEEQIDAAQAVQHQALKADLLQRILAQSPASGRPLYVEFLPDFGVDAR